MLWTRLVRNPKTPKVSPDMRTLTARHFFVNYPRRRKDNPVMVLSDLPEVGDFLDFVETTLDGVGDDDLVDNERRRYVKKLGLERPQGHQRVLQADFEVGRFGETGGSRRVRDHQPTHDHGPDEANVVTVRVVFVVPENSRMGLMFAERYHPLSAASPVLSYLQNAWNGRDWQQKLALRSDSVVFPDAWADGAAAASFSAVSRGHSTDFEGIPNVRGNALGNLTMKFVPENEGMGARVLAALRGAEPFERARILGVESLADELDTVKAEMIGVDGNSKVVNIDDIKPPSMSWTLRGNEADPTQPNYLTTRVLQECPEIYERNGFDWHPM